MFNLRNLSRQVWLEGIYCYQIIIHNLLKCESKNDITCEGLILLSTLDLINSFLVKDTGKSSPGYLNCKCGLLRWRLRIPWQAQEEEVTSLWIRQGAIKKMRVEYKLLPCEFPEINWIQAPNSKTMYWAFWLWFSPSQSLWPNLQLLWMGSYAFPTIRAW